MAERILATGAIREQILTELQAYRDGHADYVKEVHPQEFLLPLSELTIQNRYSSLIYNSYLKSMRLFVQFVNLRYQQFLTELDPNHSHQIHHLIIQSMLSGKMRELCKHLDALLSEKRSFVSLFRASHF